MNIKSNQDESRTFIYGLEIIKEIRANLDKCEADLCSDDPHCNNLGFITEHIIPELVYQLRLTGRDIYNRSIQKVNLEG